MTQKHELTLEETRHIAHLARLALREDELAAYATTLTSILRYFEALDAVDTSDVKPTAHALPTFDVFRDDEVVPALPPDEVMVQAPDARDSYFRVPKVLDQE